jgi:hypothetical protein
MSIMTTALYLLDVIEFIYFCVGSGDRRFWEENTVWHRQILRLTMTDYKLFVF